MSTKSLAELGDRPAHPKRPFHRVLSLGGASQGGVIRTAPSHRISISARTGR
jgi:hypothetical protein